MIKKIIDTFTDNKYAIIWTISYIIVMWLILSFLFNFNMFSFNDWNKVLHAHLHGFPGFVFGILVLSALPLYITTTSIIIRNKKPLFTIPLPEILKPVPEEKPTVQESEPETPKTEESVTTTQSIEEELVTKRVPTELRTAFIRARNNISFNTPKTNFDLTNITENKIATEEDLNTANSQDEIESMPLPEDFNFDTDSEPESENFMPNFAPVFQDLDFDIKGEEKSNNDSNLTEETKRYLSNNGQEIKIEDDILINNKYAVGIHEDEDFWIADDNTWFAAGKQKESPADKAKEKAKKYNVQAVLYLASTNIMDLETRIEQWESEGIKTIKSLSELD